MAAWPYHFQSAGAEAGEIEQGQRRFGFAAPKILSSSKSKLKHLKMARLSVLAALLCSAAAFLAPLRPTAAPKLAARSTEQQVEARRAHEVAVPAAAQLAGLLALATITVGAPEVACVAAWTHFATATESALGLPALDLSSATRRLREPHAARHDREILTRAGSPQ